VSDPLAPGGGDFLRNMLGDLLRLIRTEGPLQWELAFQLATSVAAGDEPDPNPDPLARIRLEELSAIAELHVAEVTGMVLGSGVSGLRLVPTTRVEWARRSLEAWRPLLDRLAAALTSTPEGPGRSSPTMPGAPGPSSPKMPGPLGFGPPAGTGSDEAGGASLARGDDAQELPVDPFLGEPDPLLGSDPVGDEDPEDMDLAEMIGRWTSAMAPAMAAMQVGSVVGHLARRSLGQYDLPLPRTPSDEILVAVGNLQRFAEEWSLPLDDLQLWLCAHEMAFHAVLSRPQVASRLEGLVVAHSKLVRPDPRDLEGLLQGIDPGSIPGLSQIIGDPSLLGDTDRGPSPELEKVRAQLAALTAAIAGYAEYVTSVVAARLIGGHAPIGEAMRRRRVGRGEGERVAESLFGLHLDQEDLDRGAAFVQGVLDRSGDLARLWTDAEHLPTPAEIDAPGLWLARLDLETKGA
jgi:putative hydrolase